MESRLEKRQSKSDHDIVDSDNEFHTPLREIFSFILIKTENFRTKKQFRTRSLQKKEFFFY